MSGTGGDVEYSISDDEYRAMAKAVPHVCTPATACTCSIGAQGPSEQCPEHGHPWPPRCNRGHFLRWETMAPPPLRRFVCYFYRVSWAHVNLGFHLDFKSPNVELHVPFGFFRLGWVKPVRIKTAQQIHNDVFGYEGKPK